MHEKEGKKQGRTNVWKRKVKPEGKGEGVEMVLGTHQRAVFKFNSHVFCPKIVYGRNDFQIFTVRFLIFSGQCY